MSILDHSFQITVVVGGLLIIALLSRRENRPANLLLSCILLGAIVFQYVIALKATGKIQQYPYLWRSPLPLAVLVNTLLYLYVLALTVPGFKIARFPKALYLPLIFSLLWYGVLQAIPRTSSLWHHQDWILMERYVRGIFSFLIKSLFLFLCFLQIHRYRHYVTQYFSDLRRIRLRWLESLLVIFAVPWLLRGFDILSGPYLTVEKIGVPLISLCMLALGFLGLRQAPIFSTEEIEPELTFFSEAELSEWKQKIKEFMEKQKPYLNPELRLVDLAAGMGLKGYKISEILNRGFGESFYHFVNHYRVEEAKNRLTDPQFEHMNILGIAVDSGFNSKSVFNEVFRKTTGTTPSEFRKQKSA